MSRSGPKENLVESSMRRLAVAGLWLFVVTAVASLTWFVIGRAGREVGVVQVALPAGSTVSATSPPTTSPGRPTPGASRTDDDEPTATTGTSATTPKPRHTSAAPTTARTTAAAQGPSPVRATFSTAGGTVTASCTGSTIALVSATPRDGYRLYQDLEDGALEVSFTAGYGGEESENEDVELHLVCQRGTPVEHA